MKDKKTTVICILIVIGVLTHGIFLLLKKQEKKIGYKKRYIRTQTIPWQEIR